MAADSEPESEVFEITDFTTASEWERFISKVEEVLNDWKLIGNSLGKPLEKGVFTSGTWEEKSDEISFADFKFSVTHHYLVQESTDKEGKDEVLEDVIPQAMQDLLCMNNDFPPRAHCLGCPLTPLPPVSIAIRFTYVLQDWQQYFWPQQPPDIDALVGGEVGGLEFGKLPFGACEDPISELHLATTWPHLTEGIIVDNDVYSDLDPIQAPHWSVRVRKADNPQCLLGDFVTEFFKICRRKESTDEILGRSTFEEEGREIADITHALSKLTEPAPVPIHKLSVSNMVHTAKKKIRKHRGVEESPLNNDVLNTILLFLFPDAASEKPLDGTSSTDNNNPPSESEEYNLYNQFKSAPSDSLTYKLALCLCMINLYHGGLKGVAHLWQEFVLEMRFRWENNFLIPGLASGPPDLRCCLLHQKLQMLNCCIERKKARDEGRKTNTSDNVTNTYPGDAGKAGDQLGPDNLKDTDKEKGEVGKSWDSWSDSEEEFFECLSDTEELKGNGQEGGKKGGPKEMANLKPEGRLIQHGKLTLLHNGEPLYIPVTQEPAPMTEDLLEEQSEVLAKLGTSAEGAHLRARMQSACLLSDMESFKAANPGCFLEDFVRWYSPRDYIEEETIDEKGNMVLKGELSARMKIPSNMWVEAWETAKPIPARRQRRLFDDTREAEKVLHYLAVQKPADLARHLLPCVIHAAVLKVKEEESLENISSVKKIIKQMISHSSKVLHFPNPEDKKLEEIIHQITNVEAIIARARSLKAKFGTERCEQEEEKEDLERFVSCLLEQPEVLVIGAGRGHAGRIIHKLFVNAQRAAAMAPAEEELKRTGSPEERRQNSVSDFPPPAGRELILRSTVPRPAPYSRALPQRMYSVLTREDFRLAGAFSSDTSFF
uniref:Rab3 GTPase-activating protein catalytic subunit n=1 Tax=Equus caballus TaxID=9796 RepID=A0A9L0TF04_HORSE